MVLTLQQTTQAVAANINAFFQAYGGTAPYSYAILPGGAGGTINTTTGAYTAPAVVSSANAYVFNAPVPTQLYDIIQVTDAAGVTSRSQILVGTPLMLFCDVLQRSLQLAYGRVYLWDQKLFQPKDSALYVAVSVPRCKPFSNVNQLVSVPGGGLNSVQITNMLAQIDVDAISRGPAARDRKEEIILAFNSIYAQQQQELNSFYIGKIPPGGQFLNLSDVDGDAIPYRYRISVNLQYAVTKTTAAEYYNDFNNPPTVDTNS